MLFHDHVVITPWLLLINKYYYTYLSPTIFTAAIYDRRLTVGITKLDLIGEQEASTEEVRDKTIKTIEAATQLNLSKDLVVPLSGKWAMSANKLNNCLKGGHHDEVSSAREEVLSVLEANHSQLDIPCGQGESIKVALSSRFDSYTLVRMLEKVSGFEELKKRYV